MTIANLARLPLARIPRPRARERRCPAPGGRAGHQGDRHRPGGGDPERREPAEDPDRPVAPAPARRVRHLGAHARHRRRCQGRDLPDHARGDRGRKSHPHDLVGAAGGDRDVRPHPGHEVRAGTRGRSTSTRAAPRRSRSCPSPSGTSTPSTGVMRHEAGASAAAAATRGAAVAPAAHRAGRAGVADPRGAARILHHGLAPVPGVENLRNVFMIQPIGLGLASLGQAVVVISGGIDLSVGSVLSLLSSLAAGLYRVNQGIHPVLVALVLVALGAAAGSINGLLVVGLRVPPFMATFATMSLFQGAVLFYAPRTIGGIPALVPVHLRRDHPGDPLRHHPVRRGARRVHYLHQQEPPGPAHLRRRRRPVRLPDLGHPRAAGPFPRLPPLRSPGGDRRDLHDLPVRRRRAEGRHGLRAGLHHRGGDRRA